MKSFVERLVSAAVHAEVAPPDGARSDRGLQAAVARSLDISRQTVSYWFRGGEPGSEHLVAIAQRWGISAHWLQTGEGSMLDVSSNGDLSSEEQDLVKNYRMATPKVRKIISNMARAARKSVVTIAAVIPPLLAPAPGEAGVLHKTNFAFDFSGIHIACRKWFRFLITSCLVSPQRDDLSLA